MRPKRLVLASVLAVLLAGCSTSSTGSTATDGAATSDTSSPTGQGPSPGCSQPDEAFAAVGENGTMSSGGQQRVFSLFVPEGDSRTPRPLVVNMHGALGTRQQQESNTGMGALGLREGFVTVAPQALGDKPIWALRPNGPDVPFVEALIDEVEQKVCIDESRVYLTGFSMGGMMSMVLACRTPERYAAIAPVAGAIDVPDCADRTTAVPMLTMHGTSDKVVRFDGGFDDRVGVLVGNRGGGPTREQIVADWADANGCGDQTTAEEIDPDVDHVVYDCPVGEGVELYVVEDGGHTWPGSPPNPYSDAVAGKTTRAVSATEEIWAFFSEHRRGG